MSVSVSEGTDFGQKKKLNQKFTGLWFKPLNHQNKPVYSPM